MKSSFWGGKALTLAVFSVSLCACGSYSPGRADGRSLDTSTDPQVRAFYQLRQGKTAWDKKSEQALIEIINQSPTNGLKPDLFLKQPISKDSRDASLTAAALKYAAALAHGVANPAKLYPDYTIPRPNPDIAAGLARALQSGRLKEWYASLPPQTDEYLALSQAHLRYLKLAASGKPSSIPEGKAIKPGYRDQRVPFIAAALIAEGYLGAPPANLSQHYTPAIVSAVKQLQADWGMRPNGIVDNGAIAVLNAGPAALARQLAINLERLRWLDRTAPDTRIDVNTAAAFLDYWRGGQHIDHREVVPGEPDKPTPQLQAPMFQLVANPKWRVPDSIASKDLSTKSESWLQDNDFVVENGKYVQQSGDKNSLGLVKFDLQDKQQIYLHDTPAKALFALPQRHRSHGCVRVQNALQFAAMLAMQDDVADKFQQAMSSGDESYVKLRTDIPVRLIYHTAFWAGGRVGFRPDVYGWDDEVARALGLVKTASLPSSRQAAGDVGP